MFDWLLGLWVCVFFVIWLPENLLPLFGMFVCCFWLTCFCCVPWFVCFALVFRWLLLVCDT